MARKPRGLPPGVTHQDVNPANPTKSRGKWDGVNATRNTPGKERSKSEVRYSQRLELLKRAGEVLWWAHEPIRLELANRLHYTPDFGVVWTSGLFELVEVKGPRGWKLDPKGHVKFKQAGEQFRMFRFRAAIEHKPNKFRDEVYTPLSPWPPVGPFRACLTGSCCVGCQNCDPSE